MPDGVRPWQVSNVGVRLAVRLTPKSSRDGVKGVELRADGAWLTVSVRAVPENGKANAALIAVLAKWLGVAKSRLELVSGSHSRSKTVAITGDPIELSQHIVEQLKT